MSALHETPRWRDTSLGTRVSEWECSICKLRPHAPRQLAAAHVVGVAELRRFGGAQAVERWGFDKANLVSLCSTDHKAYDYFVCCVRDPARLHPSVRGRLRARVRRFAEAFAALKWRREALLAEITATLGAEAPEAKQ